MARRNHTTPLGCIACDELSELGAGTEFWLINNPSILSALDTHSIALSNKSLILIFGWSDDPFDNIKVKIHPELSPIDAEYITAIEWLVFDDIRVLAVGISSGYLLIYSLDGGLIHKQIIYPTRILKLRVRGTKRDISQDISNEEVCIVMNGVIARFDGSDLQDMLRRWFRETQTNFWDQKRKKRDLDDFEDSFERVPYQLWSVNKYGACADAAITGVMPPPLMDFEVLPY
ncbi:hypothetical protein SOVF_160380 isoform B [Spinacia oleracea]|nr:hypothetical protein SOVF_160380 isoform B [Spinacia oleracea]